MYFKDLFADTIKGAQNKTRNWSQWNRSINNNDVNWYQDTFFHSYNQHKNVSNDIHCTVMRTKRENTNIR